MLPFIFLKTNHPFKKDLLSAGHYLGLIQWRTWRSPHDAHIFTVDGLGLESYTRNCWQRLPLRLGLSWGREWQEDKPQHAFLPLECWFVWNIFTIQKKKKNTNGTSYFQKKLKMLGVMMVLWLCPFLKSNVLWGI